MLECRNFSRPLSGETDGVRACAERLAIVWRVKTYAELITTVHTLIDMEHFRLKGPVLRIRRLPLGSARTAGPRSLFQV